MPVPDDPRELSRSQFLRGGAMLLGGAAATSVLRPAAAAAAAAGASSRPSRHRGDPQPIPGGFDDHFNPVPSDPFIHVLPPALGFEMSTITDFIGVVGAADMQGTATGSDGSSYTFDTDMRFMKGLFVDDDGRLREGAFGFV
jgi:hypothetical protein